MTIKTMLAAGWIEEVPEGAVGRQMGYRITEAGEAAYRIGRASKPPRKPTRLKALSPRISLLPPRIGKARLKRRERNEELNGSDWRNGAFEASKRHSVPARCFSPAALHIPMSGRTLIRALIRLNFDEQDYNGHWGETSIDDILLGQENSIVETAKTEGFPDEFIDRLTWEGEIYPAYDKGICLFAGSDDVAGRLLQFSIPQTACRELRDIERRLERENFHAVEAAMEALIDLIAADIEYDVAEGTLWYRGRIGFAGSETHLDFNTVTRVVKPYKGGDIAALPPPRANAGRMNRAGVSALYVASEIDTALAEIRPHPGHTISVAGFRSARPLRVARFDVPISNFCSSDQRLDKFAVIHHIDTLLSMPVIPEERHRYAATQLLADVLIRRGFDAISYRSSVGSGKNLCIFEPALFTFDETASTVRFVDRLAYHFSEVAMDRPGIF